MRGRVARALAGLLLVAATVAGSAAPAAAAGTWLAPVRDRYEVGDVATLVAYVGRGTLGWLDEGPYYGYLHTAGSAPGTPSSRGEPLGRITIEETGASDWTALRVSLEVPLTGLVPGHYEVGYCNDPCLNGLGDLIGSRPISVGVDPVEPLTREWPLDEPLIRILAPGALVSGPGYQAPASEIWAGRVVPAPSPSPSPPPAPPADPSVVAPAVVAPVVPVFRETAAPPAPAPAPVPDRPAPSSVRAASDDGGSPALVLLGVLLVAACTGGVLRALRQEGTAPSNPLAARPA